MSALAERRWQYRYCANAVHGVCNWLIRDGSADTLCLACRHNRTIPDLSLPENLPRWRKIEVAKHRLFYTRKVECGVARRPRCAWMRSWMKVSFTNTEVPNGPGQQ
jgi:hypothetical protein